VDHRLHVTPAFRDRIFIFFYVFFQKRAPFEPNLGFSEFLIFDFSGFFVEFEVSPNTQKLKPKKGRLKIAPGGQKKSNSKNRRPKIKKSKNSKNQKNQTLKIEDEETPFKRRLALSIFDFFRFFGF
jgi:hypothetical protein